MNLQKISLSALKGKRIAILGYGNQGRAQSLNLRDSGVDVLVGARPGTAFEAAKKDGFSPIPFDEAAKQADVVMFLLPDQVIPGIYGALTNVLKSSPKSVGFSHGFAYHFGYLELFENCAYFLVSPKGAGAILRAKFAAKGGLPGVYAIGANARPETRDLVLAYAKAIGVAHSVLLETTFKEETECDLLGEQAVLCGGILQLMEAATQILVKHGHTPEMAFFECCYEARLILELWMTYGPAGIAGKISPTAFYGGLTRGRRLVTDATKAEMETIFTEIRSGAFAKEWMREVEAGTPLLEAEKARLARSELDRVYKDLAAKF